MASKRTIIHIFVVALILTQLVSGCRLSTRPLEENGEDFLKPEETEVPDVPEELETEEREEPTLRVYIAEKGTVETLPLEEYIMGVVAAEMEPDWPVESLAAQAIIARTFTLQKIDEQGGVPDKNAHASTDIEEFQAYAPEKISANVRQAVEETRGKVIVKDGEFIRAWFHAYAGTKTAEADEGLAFEEGNPDYIKIVDSPGTAIIPPEERDWQASFSLDEVREAVTAKTGQDPGPVNNVEITEKGPSGRAVTIKVNDVKITGAEFRLALGSKEMRSTLIEDLELEDGSLVMSGTGYGHGVGMCQWGARALAEQGREPEDIVDYFYRDVEIVKLWG
ncbi:MAG TPA: SpoIID/LytB domain-containing protein [Firmicutes bacterium]|nr:SpoIID/LytB domain-containing protein [Bacillota bacterium]